MLDPERFLSWEGGGLVSSRVGNQRSKRHYAGLHCHESAPSCVFKIHAVKLEY